MSRPIGLSILFALLGCSQTPSSATAPEVPNPGADASELTEGRGLAQAMADAFERRGFEGGAVMIDASTGQVIAQSGSRAPAPPGSSVKPLLEAAALRAGAIEPTHRHRCTGSLELDGETLSCFGRHGDTDIERGLATSCNAFAFDVASRLGDTAVRESLEGFGFRVPAPLPGVASSVDAATIGTGHGGLASTPLQLARAYRDSLVVRDDDASRVVRRGMVAAVAFPDGTATRCAIDGISVGAKTGTAGHTADDTYDAWLVALAPVGDPEIVLVVHVHGGGAAPETAAPTAADILKAWRGSR